MKMISLKMPGLLSARLEQVAKKQGRSKSEVVRAALEQFLENEKPLSARELAGDLVGCCRGPADLSTNPRYLEGYGK